MCGLDVWKDFVLRPHQCGFDSKSLICLDCVPTKNIPFSPSRKLPLTMKFSLHFTSTNTNTHMPTVTWTQTQPHTLILTYMHAGTHSHTWLEKEKPAQISLHLYNPWGKATTYWQVAAGHSTLWKGFIVLFYNPPFIQYLQWLVRHVIIHLLL